MKHSIVGRHFGTWCLVACTFVLPLMAACGDDEIVTGGKQEADAGQQNVEPEVDAGETQQQVDAGPVEPPFECVDNVITPLAQLCVGNQCFDKASTDCTREGRVCIPDDVMGATCQAPVVGDPCFEDTSLVCGGPTENGALYCKDGMFEDSGLDCTDVGGWCVDKFTEAHSYVSCGEGDAEVRYAMQDAACAMEGRHACSFDRQTVLRCEGGHWDALRHCGDQACKLVHPKDTPDDPYVACANGSATLGDPCDTEGAAYCTNDLGMVIECQAGRLRELMACSGGQQCGYLLKNSQLLLSCRASTYAPGDDCHFPEGMKLCDASGMQVLVCSEKVVELDTTCEAGTTCQATVEFGVPTVACK